MSYSNRSSVGQSGPSQSRGIVSPLSLPSMSAVSGDGSHQMGPGFDTTGQIAPPGKKPRVTGTLWEDEGTLCFQVEAKGISVARREGKEDLSSNSTLLSLI